MRSLKNQSMFSTQPFYLFFIIVIGWGSNKLFQLFQKEIIFTQHFCIRRFCKLLFKVLSKKGIPHALLREILLHWENKSRRNCNP